MFGTLPPIKGVSDYCIEQTRGLAKHVRVEFYNFKSIYPEFLYKGGGTKENDPVFAADSAPNLDVHSTLAWYNPFGWIAAGLAAKGEIVHFHYWTSYLFPVFFTIALASKLRGKKVVCTVHNVVGHESGFADRLLSSILYRVPDKLIVHTQANRGQMLSQFQIPARKIEVIAHGIYGFYVGENVSQAQARKKLGIPKEAKAMLFFGNVRKYKGLECLLEAFLAMRKKIPGLFLIVAGKPWSEELERLAREKLAGVKSSKAVLSYIPSSEIKYYFSAADLVVLPYSDFAAQSGPGNIALAFEKPLLVSDAGGLPELVVDKKMIFPAGDCAALQRGIEYAFSKGVLRSLQAHSKRLREKYSWATIARQTLNVYNELLGLTRI